MEEKTKGDLKNIKDINMMVIRIIRDLPLQDVVDTLKIKKEVVLEIKSMSARQIFKLVEVNQLLIKINKDDLAKKINDINRKYHW